MPDVLPRVAAAKALGGTVGTTTRAIVEPHAAANR